MVNRRHSLQSGGKRGDENPSLIMTLHPHLKIVAPVLYPRVPQLVVTWAHLQVKEVRKRKSSNLESIDIES